MAKPNLFPQYQAAVITDPVEGLQTFRRKEIAESRGWVRYWVEHFESPDVSRPVQVAVVGDYGSGKTHLLLDAAATLIGETKGKAHILRLIAPEGTPSAWFHLENSPLRKPDSSRPDSGPPLAELVAKLEVEAAIKVAKSAAAWEQVAERLQKDPAYLSDAIEQNKLNATMVEDRLRTDLKEICGPFVSSDVQAALLGLTSNETASFARDWLYGLLLNEEQGSKLRLTQRQAGDAELLGILAATAALFGHFKRPFALMIDELEHFADYDRAHSEKKNLTWLKRLLEAMAPTWALIYVAGHATEAWELEPNLKSRFKVEILMVVLEPAEIIDYVKFVVSRIPEGLVEHAADIQAATGGRMRDVLTMCSMLSDATDNFERPILAEQIRARSGIQEERAINTVQGLLQEMGFTVERETNLGSTPFDLLVSHNGRALAVFEFRHTTTQRHPTHEVNRFLEKRREVATRYPNLVFCFVAEGNADPDITEAAQATDAPVRYFDTKRPDFMTGIRSAMEQLRSTKDQPAQPQESLAVADEALKLVGETQVIDRRILQANSDENPKLLEELRRQRIALDQQLDALRRNSEQRDQAFLLKLQELEEQRRRDFEELEQRAEAARLKAPDSRASSLADATVPPDPLENTYAEIMGEYRPVRATRVGLGSAMFLLGVGVFALGAAMFFVLPSLFGVETSAAVKQSGNTTVAAERLLAQAGGIAVAATGLYLAIQVLVSTRRFYEHARRLLREIYIRSRDVADLTIADSTLQVLLVENGPVRGMLRAREELAGRIRVLRPDFDAPAAAQSSSYPGDYPNQSSS